jgi:ADP-heptose:LPS heptosyltransferase
MINIVVFRGGALGDFVLGLPLIDCIHAAYPSAIITLVAPRPWLPLAWRQGASIAGVPIDDPAISELYGGRLPVQTNHQGRVLPRDAELVLLLTAREDAGLADAWRAMGARRVVWCSPLPDPNGDEHATDRVLRALEPLGLPVVTRRPRVALTADELKEAVAWLTTHLPGGAGPIVALHPGSGGAWKRWPVEGFAELAKLLSARYQARIMLIAGPADADVVARFRHLAAGIVFAEATELAPRQLAALLHRTDVFVGNDSGVAHLAAAVDSAVVALFGPTNDRVWAPRSERVTILRGVLGVVPPAKGAASSTVWRDRPWEPPLETERVYAAVARSLPKDS